MTTRSLDVQRAAPPARRSRSVAPAALVAAGVLSMQSPARAIQDCTTLALEDGLCRSKASWAAVAAHACGSGDVTSVTVAARCSNGRFAKAAALCCVATSLVCCQTAAGFSVTDADACAGSAYAASRCASTVCCGTPAGAGLTSLDGCLPSDRLPMAACEGGGAGPSSPVVDTAQDRCFDASAEIPCATPGSAWGGQDAWYQGAQPSLTDNGDGTVTDGVTGLMWQKSPGPKVTYAQAQAGAASLTLAGHSDWRLPTIKELYSLIRFDGIEPSCCETLAMCPNIQPFLDNTVLDFAYGDTTTGDRVIDAQYASSTVYVGSSELGTLAFGVNFADGRIKGYPTGMVGGKTMTLFARYVRGAAYGDNAFVDNGDGTVTDQATGLTWLQEDSGAFGAAGLDWKEALQWAESLEFAGHDDWRLPTAKELQSIVDYGRSPASSSSPALDPVFQATPILDEGGASTWGYYWTGTTHVDAAGGGSKAVYVAFGEAKGFMQDPFGKVQLVDVHGAGAQRSDPKAGDPASYPYGEGPQGDVIRIYNLVRPVRGGVTAGAVTPATYIPGPGANQCGGAGGPSGIAMCGQVPVGLPCCGDGFCGGPETKTNCPADC